MTKIPKVSKDTVPIVLSVDPGKVNFAYCLMTLSGEIITTGLFPNNVTDLKNSKIFTSDVKNFRTEIQKLISDKRVFIVFERFVPRGSKYTGNLVEITCLKIGIMLSSLIENNKTKITPVMASSWKNQFKKLGVEITNDSAPPHIFDAILIGFYFLFQNKKIDLKTLKILTSSKRYGNMNFGWYCFKNQWYHGERQQEHLKGRRNSFGN